MFVKKQILMDAVSWSLFWEKRHEFDPFTRWQAGFIRYIFGWVTQEEGSEFNRTCNTVFQDMTGKYKHQSRYFNTSKALSKFLRHANSNLTYLFDSDGTVNIGSAFNELGTDNPTHHQISSRFCSDVDMQRQAKISDLCLCQLDLETFWISTSTTMGSQNGCSSRTLKQDR